MLGRPFADRLRAPRAWTRVALDTGRWRLALVLAALPALALLACALLIPAFAEEMTEAQRVRDAFARFISGLITAATISVGFATLSIKRGIKGIGELEEHIDADAAFSDRVRRLTDGRDAPLGVGPLLEALLAAVARRASASGLSELTEHARDVAARVRAADGRPDELLRASLEFEGEAAWRLARERQLADLAEALRETDVARSYTRTLATQWGLSRMSQGIAISSFIAVICATGVVLAYPDGADAIASASVVAGALFVVLLPLAVFVSFVLRFIFLNEHTLPLGHFVLGPENPDVAAHR